MRRIRPSQMFVSAVVAVTLAGCTGSGAGAPPAESSLADMEPVTLTVSFPLGDGSTTDMAIRRFLEHVTSETDGKIEFDVYSSQSLHDGLDALSAVESGLTDITFHHQGYWPDNLIAANWATNAVVPFSGTGFLQTGLANAPSMQSLYEESSDIREDLAEHDAVPLLIWGSPPFILQCTEPVETPETASGMMTKSGGPPFVHDIEALGMVDTYVESPEHYEALQRGVIDCVALTAPSVMNEGLWEIAKYNMPANLSPALGSGFMMNKTVYESLPLEVQQIFHDGKAIILTEFMKQSYIAYEDFAREAPDMGVEIVEPTELNAVLDEASQARADAPIDAPESVDDPQGIMDTFQTSMDTWGVTLEDEFGIPPGDPTTLPATEEEFLTVWQSAGEFDWDGYEQEVRDFLAEYRP